MDQRQSKMSIMVFYVIAGPPSSFLYSQPGFAFLDSQMLALEERLSGANPLFIDCTVV